MKIKKKNIRGRGSGQGGCERGIKVFVKMQKKIVVVRGGGGGGGGADRNNSWENFQVRICRSQV